MLCRPIGRNAGILVVSRSALTAPTSLSLTHAVLALPFNCELRMSGYLSMSSPSNRHVGLESSRQTKLNPQTWHDDLVYTCNCKGADLTAAEVPVLTIEVPSHARKSVESDASCTNVQKQEARIRILPGVHLLRNDGGKYQCDYPSGPNKKQ